MPKGQRYKTADDVFPTRIRGVERPRAYYNDWNHQIVMARTRGTDLSRAHIGMDLFGPAPDFAGLARCRLRVNEIAVCVVAFSIPTVPLQARPMRQHAN